jgi:hypothetical protein
MVINLKAAKALGRSMPARQAVWEGTEMPAVVRAVRAAAETIGVDLLGVPVASPMQEAEYRRAFEIISIEKMKRWWCKMLRRTLRIANSLLISLKRRKFRQSTPSRLW